MAKTFKGMLPTDGDLHQRESQWVTFLEKLEEHAKPGQDLNDDELDNGLDILLGDESSEDDENQEEELDVIVISDDDKDDYNQFTELLAEGRKAIQERKKHWEETGDSFILDHLSAQDMSVNDWLKHNVNETGACNLDISTAYGDLCKKRKLQSTFLEATLVAPQSNRNIVFRKSHSVEPLSPTAKMCLQNGPVTPSSSGKRPISMVRPQSESTYNRRLSGVTKPKHKRDLIKSVRRLTTVLESPVAAGPSLESLREKFKLPQYKLPRVRTIIYSPMQPIVPQQFSYVLKRKTFDPSKTLVYEPPSDANSSSESDDDIFMICKRKFGGKIYEI